MGTIGVIKCAVADEGGPIDYVTVEGHIYGDWGVHQLIRRDGSHGEMSITHLPSMRRLPLLLRLSNENYHAIAAALAERMPRRDSRWMGGDVDDARILGDIIASVVREPITALLKTDVPTPAPAVAPYAEHCDSCTCRLPVAPTTTDLGTTDPGRWAANDGKWTVSDNEERWECGETFDTRDEAISYGLNVYASEQGLEDGRRIWVGQVSAITADTLVGTISADSLIETMDLHLYDLIGDVSDDGIDAPLEAVHDLDEQLERVLRNWLKTHDLVPDMCQLEHITDHVYYACESADADGRGCTKAQGHGGDHDFA